MVLTIFELLLTTTGKQVSSITCGQDFCAAVTSTGDLYTWGCATYGRLGHGNSKYNSTVDFVHKVLQNSDSISPSVCGGTNRQIRCAHRLWSSTLHSINRCEIMTSFGLL